MREKNRVLLILVFLMVLATIALINSAHITPVSDYDRIISLAGKTKMAYENIRLEKDRLAIDYSNHASGMLGPELTGITTTLGSKESKGTATNPNFVGVLYDYMTALNLKAGDEIALNLSSSFPSLNIQAILVAEELGLKPIIITSLGASTYGGTDEAFTYLDMEHFLFNKGLIHHKSLIYSLGGDYDIGHNMNQESISLITERLKNKGYTLYYERNIEENLKHRLDLYRSCKALVNIGGNTVSETSAEIGYFSQYGYLEASKLLNYDGQGLIGHFLNTGRDVIHLLNIKDIALSYDMPIDPSYDGLIGQGGVYEERCYNPWLAFFIVGLFILGMGSYYYEKEKEIETALSKCIE